MADRIQTGGDDGHALTTPEPRLAPILRRLGPSNPRLIAAVRLLALAVFAASAVSTITGPRPDLLRPTTLGSDTWNYGAAAERLVSDHPLYRLAPGDRPVPQDNPPAWRAPILSPPTVAVPWLPFLVLPEGFRQLAWWALHLAVVVGIVVFLLISAPALGALAAIPVLLVAGSETWTGNVNGFLLGAAILLWWAHSTSTRVSARRRAVAAAALGLGIAVKLTPASLLGFLLRERAWRSLLIVGVSGLLVVGLSVLLAGRHAFVAYLGIAATTAATPTSLTALAEALAIPPAAARLVPYLVFVIGTGIAAVAPSRRASFAIAWATVVVCTPVLRLSNLSLLVGCLAPWVSDAPRLAWRARVSAAGAGAVTAVALVASVATGALATSSLEIANESQAEVIVRMPALGQFASFGVRVPAGTTGVVWHDLATRVEEPLFVFDRRCAPLGTATLPLSGGSLVIAG
ncbi:MAG TPA: glycosyltransferase 87 family protein, partial [Candidatus Limnocylindrales bacterium]|nr:glycosyltransferase 87 family protein [Candidatus Limnocylindrales bacterium]